MAHFAKLDQNNIVLEVNAVNNDMLDSENEESSGVAFLTEWSGGYANWKQTSYNNRIRFNYAGIGMFYDEDKDAFIPIKPFASWVLDEATCQWQAPTPNPTGDKFYTWDEASLAWVEIQ